MIAGALFCVPGIRDLVRRQCSLVELGADESAMMLGLTTGPRSPGPC